MNERSASRRVSVALAAIATVALLAPAASGDDSRGSRVPVFDFPSAGHDLSDGETDQAFANLTQALERPGVPRLPPSGEIQRVDDGTLEVSYENETGRHSFQVPLTPRQNLSLAVSPEDVEPYGVMFFHPEPRSFVEARVLLDPAPADGSADAVEEARSILDRLGVNHTGSRIETFSTGNLTGFVSEVYYPGPGEGDRPDQPSVSLVCPNCTDVEVSTPGMSTNWARFVFDESGRPIFIEIGPWIDLGATDVLPAERLRTLAEQGLDEEGIRNRTGGSGTWTWLANDLDFSDGPMFQYVYGIDRGTDRTGETVAAQLALDPRTGNVTGLETTLPAQETRAKTQRSTALGTLAALTCLSAAAGAARIRTDDRR
jgi:hypothetical protein